MKRAALYLRVSTLDQHPETQALDLRQMAAQRGFEVVQEYIDRISGTRARRPGRRPLDLDRAAILRDRQHGRSLGQIAKAHGISRATVHRVIHEPASTPSENVA